MNRGWAYKAMEALSPRFRRNRYREVERRLQEWGNWGRAGSGAPSPLRTNHPDGIGRNTPSKPYTEEEPEHIAEISSIVARAPDDYRACLLEFYRRSGGVSMADLAQRRHITVKEYAKFLRVCEDYVGSYLC